MKLKMTLLAGLVVSQFAVAEENFRQHDAHVHGHVKFNIAQDGQDLLVEITAPGADVVGFEHAPKTDAEKAALTKAKATLNDVNNLLILPKAAGCQLVDADIDNTLESHQGHDDHDDHHNHKDHDDHKGHDDHHDHDHDGHDDHKGHDDHHDHKEHDDHKGHDDHDHDHDHDHHDGHGEFNVQYQFTCSDFSKLNQIDTKWFSYFPATEKVSVNLLTDTAQSATELTSGNTVIKL